MRLLKPLFKATGLLALCVLLANCGPAFQSQKGDVLVVSNAAELRAALSTAEDGDTIVLEPNEYGDLDIKGSQFEEGVSIIASEEHESNFESIHVEDSSNIHLENIRVESEEGDSEGPIEIKNSENIEMENIKIVDGEEVIVSGNEEEMNWREEKEEGHESSGEKEEAHETSGEKEEGSWGGGSDDDAGHEEGGDDDAGHVSGSDDDEGHTSGADDDAGHMGGETEDGNRASGQN